MDVLPAPSPPGPPVGFAAPESIAELTKINRLLVESARRLSSESDPEGFLESLVRTLAENIDASPVSLFEHDARAGTLALRIHYSEGVIRRGLSGDEVPLFAAPFPADITPAWAAAVRSGGRFFTETGDPAMAGMVWPGLLEWMQRIGVRDPGMVALFVGEEPVGALGISWTGGRQPKPADFPLIEALARQTAVGLRLVKLADEARENAVILANERAALDRIAELTQASDTLHRNISSLMLEQNACEFLESILLNACAACGAMSATIFRRDVRGDTIRVAAFVSGGQRVNLATDPRMEPWREAFPTPRVLSTALKPLLQGELVWFDNEEPNPERNPIFVEWHRQMGHRIVAVIPALVGETFLGFVGLCFREPVPPTPERLAQARTFAGHASLALQLTLLTEDLRREVSVRAGISERNRIARDLHDTFAQGFTGILAQLGAAEGALDRDDAPAREELRHAIARAEELARSSLAEARHSVAVMRKDDPAPSLETALRILLKRMTTGTRLRGSLEVEPEIPKLPPQVQEILRRVAQEALTNTLKHAGGAASEFSLGLKCREGHVCLVAHDNGCGFDPQKVGAESEGFGLVGMRERAALADGRMSIRTAPGEGVEITIELPFTCPDES